MVGFIPMNQNALYDEKVCQQLECLVVHVIDMLTKHWQNVKTSKILKNCVVLQHFVQHRYKIHLLSPSWMENYGQTHKDKQIFLIPSKL